MSMHEDEEKDGRLCSSQSSVSSTERQEEDTGDKTPLLESLKRIPGAVNTQLNKKDIDQVQKFHQMLERIRPQVEEYDPDLLGILLEVTNSVTSFLRNVKRYGDACLDLGSSLNKKKLEKFKKYVRVEDYRNIHSLLIIVMEKSKKCTQRLEESQNNQEAMSCKVQEAFVQLNQGKTKSTNEMTTNAAVVLGSSTVGVGLGATVVGGGIATVIAGATAAGFCAVCPPAIIAVGSGGIAAGFVAIVVGTILIPIKVRKAWLKRKQKKMYTFITKGLIGLHGYLQTVHNKLQDLGQKLKDDLERLKQLEKQCASVTTEQDLSDYSQEPRRSQAMSMPDVMKEEILSQLDELGKKMPNALKEARFFAEMSIPTDM